MSLKLISISVLAIMFLAVFAYGGFIIYFSWPITLGNVDKAGAFGDSFGVLTSLFSGLAFAGIILTILLQREELRLQRKELQLTREEFKSQHSTFKHQNFESTFFQMLRLHNDIVNSIDLSRSTKLGIVVTSGRDCFVVFISRIEANFQIEKRTTQNLTEEDRINSAYGEFWEGAKLELGHYFRYLYTIFKFIKISDIENKKLYSNIVRAQLSNQELVLLFYNCLYKHGKKKFKPLAEEFALFDNLPEEMLIEPKHRDFYLPEAFGDSMR